MGKSGGRKKKGGGANQNQSQNQNQNPSQSQSQTPNHVPTVNNTQPSSMVSNGGGIELDSSLFLKRAHELKEEGNKRFQDRDFVGALEQYEKALKLTPKMHPDRAVFHGNRAACLMQIKPIDHDKVISECSMALQVQPILLGVEPNHRDALEISRRLRPPINGARQEAQQDLQSRPSPAALGASAVRGVPIGGLGPCLPARPVPKKPGPSGTVGASNSKQDKTFMVPSTENGNEVKPTQMPKLVLKPAGGGSNKSGSNPEKSNKKEHMGSSVLPTSDVSIQWRPLKLVYANDIRLAQMPVNCTFKVLREVVSKRFPSSKSVLIKFKDNDGDLVTVTCTSEPRLAESIADSLVSPEHEPPLLEKEEPEEEEEGKLIEPEVFKADDSGSRSMVNELAGETVVDDKKTEIERQDKKKLPEGATEVDPLDKVVGSR
ncbi:hypothetical protein L6452_02388 [Arctium lappa]|uniref:Uncharacterized protein n=1 Tax=Arctium lappa TaxID=4217 RepID=A0ACB9FJE9_ARCLA|nr:hypothetical protein L6452_02388 [Arctium lappa]